MIETTKKKGAKTQTIMVKCEQCGRWTSVDVTVSDLKSTVDNYRIDYKITPVYA